MMNRLSKTRFVARVLFFLAILTGVSLAMTPYRIEFVRMEATGASSEIAPPQESKVLIAEVSAYTSRPEETDDTPTITASGEEVYSGGIACPVRFKFGTQIEINGTVYTCNDRMNKRYADSNHFDIWMESYEDAIHWGRRHVEVAVLE